MLRFAKRLAWLLGGLLAVLPSRPALAQEAGAAGNLLPNPSFEERTDDGVSGWKSRAWSGAEHGRWTVESPGRSGRLCASIRSERGTDAAWTATVTVQPNTCYRLSGWIKTKDAAGAVGGLLNIQNLQQVRTPRVTGTKDWTRVSTLFWTDDKTELEINCLFGGWGQSTGQAWYDDVALERRPTIRSGPAGDRDDRPGRPACRTAGCCSGASSSTSTPDLRWAVRTGLTPVR